MYVCNAMGARKYFEVAYVLIFPCQARRVQSTQWSGIQTLKNSVLYMDVSWFLMYRTTCSKFKVLTLQYLAMEAGSMCDKCLIRST